MSKKGEKILTLGIYVGFNRLSSTKFFKEGFRHLAPCTIVLADTQDLLVHIITSQMSFMLNTVCEVLIRAVKLKQKAQ